MARKIRERKLKAPNVTIIGERLTERCYFKHLKSLKAYRYTCKPRNFSQQSIDDLQKQIDKVLADDGVAVCVFDADVTREKLAERKKLEAMQKKYAGNEKNVSFHTSRHTFATLTLAACENLELVSKLLGHKSVKTTQRYADVMLDKKVEVVNRTSSVF
jgi:site-specific recombinase XerD